MKLPTASALERVSICPASHLLPQVHTETAYATRGREIHAFLERANKIGPAKAIEEVPEEYKAFCEALDLSEFPVDPNCYASEVSLALDCKTGKARELGTGLDRKYPDVTPTEYVGTTDIVALADDHVLVVDFKSGQNVQPPIKNKQLRFLGAAAAKAYGREKAKLEIVYIRPDGTPWRERGELDIFEIDEVVRELAALRGRLLNVADTMAAGAQPDLFMGPHCKYCKAFWQCPAQVSLANALAVAPEKVITKETIAKTYRAIQAARLLLDKAEATVKAASEFEPIDIGGGMQYGPVETRRESIDATIAKEVLTKLAGPDIAEKACPAEATKTSIEKAAKFIAESFGTSAAEAKRRALDAIRDAGGVQVKTTTVYKEHKTKDAPPLRLVASGGE